VANLIPLFPLDVVLLPGARLPLHIFEPRYKEMVGECLARQQPFGIVRAQENTIAETGCTAEITAVTKKYDDGRMDIETVGRQRFEILELKQERSFLQAEVLFVEDETAASTPEAIAHALKLHAEILDVLEAEAEIRGEDPQLSYAMAGPLPLELDFKQKLLENRSESERLMALTQLFEALLPKLRLAERARQKAGGNGHVV
jgi:Lon protease-like protein